MIELEADTHGFPCPYCKKTWHVYDWGTEYNHAIIGVSDIQCPQCRK